MRRVLTPLLLTALFASGCASWTRGHAQAAAEGALVGLNDEGALLAAQLSRPEVRAAAQALAEAVALGATSALTDPERGLGPRRAPRGGQAGRRRARPLR